MLKEFMQISKKYLKFWIIATLILEVLFLIGMKNSGSSIMIVAGVLYIPVILFILITMIMDWRNAIYAVAVTLPIIPANGYLLNRLGFLNYQWLAYVLFYGVFTYSIIKHRAYKKIKLSKKFNFYNVLVILLLVLTIINSIVAFNKIISFTILFLSVIPSFAYFSFLYFLDIEDKSDLLNKVVLFVCIGVVVSAIPDLVTFLVLWSMNLKTYRTYGPLGSNFILAYSLLVYPIIIVNAKIKTDIEGKVYKLLLIIVTLSLSSQFSRGIYVAVIIMFIILFLDKKNLKLYLPVFMVIMICLSINVFQRPEISKNPNLIITSDENVSPEVKKEKKIESESKFISSQSDNRKPIWSTAIKMSKAYPLTGVGIGNFKFFYEYYSNSDRVYSDAHNFVLNNLAESGFIFTTLLMLLIISILFESLISLFKNWSDYNIRLKNIVTLSALFAYLAFGNVTGASFHSIGEIYSFTPVFIFSFFIFNFIYNKEIKMKS